MKEKNADRAMEGRTMSRDGTDRGDARFHLRGWATTPDAAKKDLEEIAQHDVAFAERQADGFATADSQIGAAAFEGLLALFPDHAHAATWKARAKELRRR